MAIERVDQPSFGKNYAMQKGLCAGDEHEEGSHNQHRLREAAHDFPNHNAH
jgi:hypothetical protein